MLKLVGFMTVLMISISALSAEIKKTDKTKMQNECSCSCANALSATEGIALHSTMRAELLERMKFEKVEGNSIFPTKKDGRFEEDYDNDLLNSFSDFLKRDLRELNRAPTYDEMQILIGSRLAQMSMQRIVVSQGFFNSIMGLGKFKEPQYTYLVKNDKVRPLMFNGSSEPVRMQVIPKLKYEELPQEDDIAGWKVIYQKANGNARPSGSELRAFVEATIEKAKQTQ